MTSSPRIPAIGEMFSEVAPHGRTAAVHEAGAPTAGAPVTEGAAATSSQPAPPVVPEDIDDATMAGLDPQARRTEVDRRIDVVFDGLAASRAQRAGGGSPFFRGLSASSDDEPPAVS